MCHNVPSNWPVDGERCPMGALVRFHWIQLKLMGLELKSNLYWYYLFLSRSLESGGSFYARQKAF